VLAEGWLPAVLCLFSSRISHGPANKAPLFRTASIFSVLYGLAATVAAIFPVGNFQITAELGLLLSPTVAWGAAVALLLYAVVLLKIENLYRATSGEQRWQLKYLLLGLTALVAIRLYTLTLANLYQAASPQVGIELAIATLVGGVLIAYALVRHRLLDADVFISRYVIYNSITLVGVGGYLLVVGMLVYGIQQFGGSVSGALVSTVLFLALTALGIGLLSDTLRWRLRHFVDSHFFKNRHDYRHEWQAVTRAVAAEHTLTGFVTALARMVKQSLGAQFVVTLVRERGSERCVAPLGAQEGTDLSPLQDGELIADKNPAWGVGENRAPVYRHSSRHKHVLFLPILSGDQRVGWLALGPRVGMIPYHLEDLELVCDMVAQTAVAIHNVRLGEELAESREQTALHQLSTFFIHDMKNTTNSLGMLAQNIRRNRDNPEFWDDAEVSISQAVTQMNTLMERLRDLREEHPPTASPVDLAMLIATNAPRWRDTTGTTLDIQVPDGLSCMGDESLLDSVLTNLVLNAAESKAKLITIAGESQGDMVEVTVTDNGIGMDPAFIATALFKPFTSTKPLGMGIGLFQSRRGIEQLGGCLTVESTQGEGSCFTVALPWAQQVGTTSLTEARGQAPQKPNGGHIR
jgi:putative PEP-CTERM system histidine kinase